MQKADKALGCLSKNSQCLHTYSIHAVSFKKGYFELQVQLMRLRREVTRNGEAERVSLVFSLKGMMIESVG